MSKQYKCIQYYPGGPSIGTIIIWHFFRNAYTTGTLDYDKQIIENYPKFWAKYLFTTEDGVDVFEEEKCFAVNTHSKMLWSENKQYFDGRSKHLIYFASKEKAQEYLDSLKEEFEVGVWYGVKLSDYSTFIVNSKEVVSTEPFRLFNTKEERDRYIRLNKPKYSIEDIRNLFEIE